MKDTKQTSKLISYWLRHHPEDGNLHIDDFGWVHVDSLIKALAEKGQVFTPIEIIELSKSFDKVRWEFSTEGDKIRATHGHSIEVILDEKAVKPPELLYHGTSLNKADAIKEHGLMAMQRQFVHLSSEIETAISVGKRHGKPILIEIDAKLLDEDGWIFYQTSDNVWLTTKIPANYISIKPWETVIENEEISLLAQLNNEVSMGHPLFNKKKNLKLIMRRHDNDDTLFLDATDNKVSMLHLTWNTLQKNSNYPSYKEYPSFDEWTKIALLPDQLNCTRFEIKKLIKMAGETNLKILLKNMTPLLNEGDYVYCAVTDLTGVAPNDIIGLFKEKEAITIILKKETADNFGLKYEYIAAWITLTVHSSLAATGLTAAFANALADKGISCNVVAAYYHDHIFVAKDDAERAMEALRKLADINKR